MTSAANSVLVLDIGNTQTVLGWFESADLTWTARWATAKEGLADDLAHSIADILAAHHAQAESLTAVAIASVVPVATPLLTAALCLLSPLEPTIVNAATAGIPIRVDYPDRVGADRIANAVAAAFLYPLPAIVMDTGTATTLSVVDSDGSLIGGTISLGLQSSAHALHQMTAQLPLSDLAQPTAQIGRNTEDSIRSGLLNGTAAMLEGLASRIASELNHKPTLILTGGNATRLLPHFRLPLIHDPDLLLKGLHQIALQQLALRQINPDQPEQAEDGRLSLVNQAKQAGHTVGKPDLHRIGGRSIGIIGAGRLGVTLGAYLRSRGFNLAGFTSRSPSSAHHAARVTGSRTYPSLKDLSRHCDVLLIATPDDEIGSTVRQLAGHLHEGQWLIHCSGSLTADLIRNNLTEADSVIIRAASLHPLFAFSHRDGRIDGLEAAAFAIEGDHEPVEIWKNDLQEIGHTVIQLSAGQKPVYHAAAVWAANFSLSVIARSCEYLELLGLTPAQAQQAILPLLDANLDNFRTRGLPEALTGPVERNDQATIRSHLSAIPDEDLDLYRQLSLILLRQARYRHPGRDDQPLVQLLRQGALQ